MMADDRREPRRILMGILLDVPLIGQQRRDTCWRAASLMLARFRSRAPGPGIPEAEAAGRALQPSEFVTMARADGLRPSQLPTAHYGPAYMSSALRIQGPLWAAGNFDFVNHVIVVTGVEDDGALFFNDPYGPNERTETLDWFNRHLSWHIRYSVLYLPRGPAR
jgi:hypothetical protein